MAVILPVIRSTNNELIVLTAVTLKINNCSLQIALCYFGIRLVSVILRMFSTFKKVILIPAFDFILLA